MVKREILAMCMESPLYFTMPVQKRLKFLKEVEQRTFCSDVREHFLTWVKTGHLRHPDENY